MAALEGQNRVTPNQTGITNNNTRADGATFYQEPTAYQIKDNDSLISFEQKLKDRFGKLPDKIAILFNAIKLRWVGKKLGFEKIVLKNNSLRAFFTTDKNSNYFEHICSDCLPTFSRIWWQ